MKPEEIDALVCTLGICSFCRGCVVDQNREELSSTLTLVWRLISERSCEDGACPLNFLVRQRVIEEAAEANRQRAIAHAQEQAGLYYEDAIRSANGDGK